MAMVPEVVFVVMPAVEAAPVVPAVVPADAVSDMVVEVEVTPVVEVVPKGYS